VSWLSDDAVDRLRAVVAEPDFSSTRYRVVREIARGGMGVVYKADDLELSRRVAIKVLLPENTTTNDAERLRSEATLVAQLEHPGIVAIHDRGVLPDGSPFYVMKLVRGETLSSRHFATASEALRLFVRICEPVAFAHSRGITHCDLKPSNVMVGEFGEVFVMDWGVANGTGGTRGYMAPEQERGPVSPATDVFALGTVLRHITAASRVPRRLAAVIAKATAMDPADRYATARELADDVVRYMDDLPVAAHPENILERTARWAARNRTLLAVIAAYLIMRAVVIIAVGR
jgi:eukaryotic-like serine/threonine-protein kinase